MARNAVGEEETDECVTEISDVQTTGVGMGLNCEEAGLGVCRTMQQCETGVCWTYGL
jgi:hypothetical protein